MVSLGEHCWLQAWSYVFDLRPQREGFNGSNGGFSESVLFSVHGLGVTPKTHFGMLYKIITRKPYDNEQR